MARLHEENRGLKIQVNIQSYKRAGAVDTLRLVPSAFVWVHEFEVAEYKKAYPDALIMTLPDSIRGSLPQVKNFIMDANCGEFDAQLFLDDDISDIGYFEKCEMVKLKSEQEFTKMLYKYTNMCIEWGYKLWGINVNPDKQCYREYTPFSTLSYISSSFSCFLKGNELRYDKRFPLKEDYDMTIQQCNKYRGLLRINKFFYIKKSASNKGGCAMYRNIEREKQQLAELQRKWGSRIVKQDKSNRSHSSDKSKSFDINPIISVPIRGV